MRTMGSGHTHPTSNARNTKPVTTSSAYPQASWNMDAAFSTLGTSVPTSVTDLASLWGLL